MTSVTGGAATLNLDGTVSFTPDANFNGAASFNYTASDGALTSNTAAVTVNVAAVNDAPDAVNNAATVLEGGFVTTVNVLLDDTDADTTLTAAMITGFSQGANGTVVSNGDGTFTYTHNGSETLSDSFTYTINDGAGGTDTATVNITVTAQNDAPDAVNNAATVLEGGFVTTVNVLLNDTDADTTLTAAMITGFSQGANGTVVSNGDGTFTYTHNGSETLSDSFTYTINDGAGGTDTATVNITVTAQNDAPTANPDTGSAGENETKSFNVLANDTDPDAGDTKTLVSIGTVSVTSSNASVNGINAASALSIVGGAQIQLVPGTLFDPLNAGETATVVVNYTMRDTAGVASSSALTLTINGAAEGPVFNVVNGTPGNDRNLNGTAAADQINGLAGNDAIEARGGDDLIIAGAGRDSVSAGGGNDTMVATINDGNDLYNGESGSDTLDFSQTSAPATVNLGTTLFGFTLDGIGSATGGQIGTDILLSIENAIGGSGNDAITGDNLANVVRGGAGNDTISGLRGDDNLAGDAGNDRLIGGRGSDLMSGGPDADTFVFQAAQSRAGDVDTITGFVVGQDHLQFQGLSVTQLAQLDVNGNSVLDTALTLDDGAAIRLLGVSGVSDWHALL